MSSVKFRNTVTRKNYRNLKSQNPNDRLQPENFVENMPNKSLKPEHRVANFSFLSNILPANHYNKQRHSAITRRNLGIVYLYDQKNAENVGKVMLSSETESDTIVALNNLYPNNLTPDENILLQRILDNVRQGVNSQIVQTLNRQFVQTRTPIPHNFYLITVSQTTKRYLKMAIAQVFSFSEWPEEVKTRIINQLRKRVMIEKMRKGWFEYKDALF